MAALAVKKRVDKFSRLNSSQREMSEGAKTPREGGTMSHSRQNYQRVECKRNLKHMSFSNITLYRTPYTHFANTLGNLAKVHAANAFNKITQYHRKTNELQRRSLQIRLKRCLQVSPSQYQVADHSKISSISTPTSSSRVLKDGFQPVTIK